MPELTDKEINLVSNEIDRQGLTYTLLKGELLDHICCDIEAEMEKGLTFNEAYRKAKRIIGNKRIRQVQDETLYLINKKYRKMKKLMYVLAIAAPILIIIGAIFKVQHWALGSLLITLALFITGILFLPVFVMVRIRDTRQQDKPVPMGLYLTGLIAGMVTITGTLFKIQHMPGAGVLLTLGLFSLAVFFLPMFAVVKIRDAREMKLPVSKSTYITGVIAGILFIAGALFKVMHWPGAGYVLVFSWLAVAVLFLPLLLINVLKQSKNQVNNFFSIILVASFISVFIMALLRSPRKNTLESVMLDEKSMVSSAVFLDQQNDMLLKAAMANGSSEALSSMQAISAEADQICTFIQSAKQEMVIRINPDNQPAILADNQIDFQRVQGLESDFPPDAIMMGSEEHPGKVYELRSMLESFKKESLALSNSEDFKSFITGQLDFSVPAMSKKSWEECYFTGPMLQIASNLSSYQLKVRMIESELLRELSSQPQE